VDQPDFGSLFDDMIYSGPSTVVPLATLIQPKIEGEIAFLVAEDITVANLPRETLRRRAGDAVAAFEIVDSAIADWKITLADTVADNASCGALVLGTQRRSLLGFEPRSAEMTLTEDDQLVSKGTGAASLGDPLAAFAWLADKCVELGDPLLAGEVVLTGALGPMVPFVRGRRYRLDITGFDTLEVLAE
jgi:2-keto-4-pentenoate hydratase